MTSLEGPLSNINVTVIVVPVNMGTVATSLLFGCCVIQAHIYYSGFAKDHLVIKLMVALVMMLELAHLACTVATMWFIAVTAYENPARLAVWPPGGIVIIPITAVTRFIVQSYFTFRLWKLTNAVLLPMLCMILSLFTAGVSFAVCGIAFRMTSLVAFYATQNLLITMWWVSQSVADATLTLALVYHLRRKRTAGFSRTSMSVNRIILWTAETGLFSSIFALLVLAFFLTMENKYVWNGLSACVGSIYGNSLLAMLNSRLVLRANHAEGAYKLENKAHRSLDRREIVGSTLPFVINITRVVEASSDDKDEAQIDHPAPLQEAPAAP
ncbi:hypothetical protein BV22DRAFT_1132647 [Leucogyrophana mollusca]|uniref:Uncharacterized protein n=1 Tax=Leucogyrophana mollusca TaxID=85980 RepID=A0ACB8B7W3_9AGAM|nr:hypothetical protein BV22DRAFT_1132647 [Leucogyrophana mollusca]